jgi:hypothetical protein
MIQQTSVSFHSLAIAPLIVTYNRNVVLITDLLVMTMSGLGTVATIQLWDTLSGKKMVSSEYPTN